MDNEDNKSIQKSYFGLPSKKRAIEMHLVRKINNHK